MRTKQALKASIAPKVVHIRSREDVESRLEKVALEHEPALRRFLKARLSGHPDHEDLLQDTFLRVARQNDVEEKLSGRSETIRSYLFSIATNVIRDRHRQFATRQKYVDLVKNDSNTHCLEPSAEDVASAQERSVDIRAAILSLRPDCRDAFLLSRFQGLSYREIADAKGISISMVEKHIIRALVQIRRRVERDY